MLFSCLYVYLSFLILNSRRTLNNTLAFRSTSLLLFDFNWKVMGFNFKCIMLIAFLIFMLFSRSQMYSLTCSYKNSEGNVQFFSLIIKVMNYIDSVYNIEPFILLKQNPFGQSILFFKSTLYSFCYFYSISLSLFMSYCIEVSKSKLYNFYPLECIVAYFMAEYMELLL